MHIYVGETVLSTRHSSQYLQEIFGLRLVEGKNRGAKTPHSQLIVLQSSATAMLQFIQYGLKMISEAFWLGHNPQLLYLRRLLLKIELGLGLALGLWLGLLLLLGLGLEIGLRIGLGIGLGLGLGIGLGLGLWFGLMLHVGLGLGLKVDDGRMSRKLCRRR